MTQTQTTALAVLDDLDQALVREVAPYLNDRITPAIARTAILALYAGAPKEQVATAFALCNRYDLDPIAGHVKVYKPAGSDRYVWTFSPDGRIELAQRHPEFEGLTFDDPEEVDGELRIRAYAWRKGWRHPVGPVVGRCKKAGKRRDGSEYPIEWAEEIARARAIKHVLRIAFGVGAGSAGGTDHVDVIDGEIVEDVTTTDEPAAASAEGLNPDGSADGRRAEPETSPPPPERAPTSAPSPSTSAQERLEEQLGAKEVDRSTELMNRILEALERAYRLPKTRESWLRSQLMARGVSTLEQLAPDALEAIAVEIEKAKRD